MKPSICTSLYIYSKRMQKSPLGTRRPVIPDPLQHFFVDLLQNHIPLVNCDGKRWNVTWVRWVCALQAGWIPKYQPFTSYIYIYTYWLVVYLPLWKILVSWDDYSQYIYIYIYGKSSIHVPNHQPVYIYINIPTLFFVAKTHMFTASIVQVSWKIHHPILLRKRLRPRSPAL